METRKAGSITKRAEQMENLSRVKDTHDLFCDSMVQAHDGLREAVSVASIGQAELSQKFHAGETDDFLYLSDVLGRIELMVASLRELSGEPEGRSVVTAVAQKEGAAVVYGVKGVSYDDGNCGGGLALFGTEREAQALVDRLVAGGAEHQRVHRVTLPLQLAAKAGAPEMTESDFDPKTWGARS